MQSRRDRVMAHNFTVGRLGTAMLEGDPDAVDAPMRRTRTGTYIGIAIAAVLCVGFLVFGLIFPGGATSWRQEGRLIVDRDTGASYLYSSGVLRPVDNSASARLVQGADAAVSLVSARSLEGVPVGGPVGIAGAPDALPTEAGLEESVWRVCALLPEDEEGERGRTALVVGDAPAPVSPSAEQAVLVSGPDGAPHLLWNGTRLRLDEEGGAVQALGYGTSDALPVTSAFLNTVPTGPDLTAPEVPGAGEDAGASAGEPRRVGQVFAVSAAEQDVQHYLLTRDGLVPLTTTQALLLLADPDVSGAAYPDSPAEALPIPAGEAHARLAEGSGPREDRHPASPPTLVGAGSSVPCLRLAPDGSLSLTMDDPAGVEAWPVQEQPGIAPGCPTPDLVGIASGRGALAAARPVGGGGASTTRYLVTDSPAKYPVLDDAALTALGYQTGQAVPVPTSLLRLLPSGPVLDPEAAALPLAPPNTAEDAGCP
ncbi:MULTISPECIES: type VII secretion protein EccB [Nocardiopsis]|uniref:Type VII secretion protein EccB n=1 Tax=Nocardiopsis sinuspersici TaxID=501010 RepID=A0A1V3BYB7_9ACTN|nr:MULTISPECIES: type VII secretion protein EccB [Nocardiopsis]NYH54478.1 type VII secretion protein EccB [Nocardiopsis sinuspersici]OOC53259.1 type VII secretion protein EccB [Nocardiopsis sinuspersici]